MSSARAVSIALRKRRRRAHGDARRGWIARALPLAMLALIIQLLAPVASSAMAAAAMAAVDPLAGAVICHAEPDAPPSSRDTDRTACGLDCVMCCVLHAAAVLDAPPAPTCAAPQRGCVRIAWRGRELGLIHLLARSQTQPRAPPFPV
ncbi:MULTISPECIES: DUF2946 family protein [Bradyrhizobium]|jgi:hypothetical protein|uniref:DUF2946 family protein n=1 Tax=Bradyrhizobium TaxID=374 RepID=UPI00005DDFD5|nr:MULTISPECIES: DUF2946 family protein [Bradyrhizobium]ABQ36566.1 putative exported protein of unknown function [Bradyrhizobium sp. BTAi1]MCL8483545.1 hypothetical protein [Bradyrhizobium denitrificans]RTM02413.1 MAG: hypothetical protein EKK32_11095 [Bradyrhizobiaceae bacterium]